MNKKNKAQRINPKAVNRRTRIDTRTIAVILIAVFFSVIIYFLASQSSGQWNVSKDGILSYPENRGKVDVRILKTETSGNYNLETISFVSGDYTVEGLLRIPSSTKKVPGIVILPGATVPKEGTTGLAEIFSNLGYASLGIEQRNRGGVDFKNDYILFTGGREPVEHKMVFDALRAVDVLRQDARIDASRIAIVGESNGGRFAIIATALDPSISGVIGISTSGYNTEAEFDKINDETLFRFSRSIDPDTYLEFIPPRKLVMLHSINDTIIPIDLAENTFEKAKQPKQFYRVTTGSHGFSEGMRVPLENELRQMFQ